MARTRIARGPLKVGNVVLVSNPSIVVGTEEANSFVAVCDDSPDGHKPYRDKPLLIRKLISGGATTTADYGAFGLRDCPVGWYSDPSVLTMPGDLLGDKNSILARTGPLTAGTYLPVSIFELKDIPHMLQHAGNLLHGLKNFPPSVLSPKNLASANLAYQFGWKPLVQDMQKVLNFSDAVGKRLKNLKKAQTAGGLKRRVSLGSDADTVSGITTLHSTWGIVINSKYTDFRKTSRWATIRWKANGIPFEQEPSFTDAFRVEFGLTKGAVPIEVWKALPWSWMFDWFANLSQAMQTSYNMIYYTPSNLCVMEHSHSKRVLQPDNGFLGLINEWEQKSRAVEAIPSPDLHVGIPFLDSFKLSILSSLAITRR